MPTLRHAGLRGRLQPTLVGAPLLRDHLVSPLPKPPAAFDYATKVDRFPMALNTELGDCTVAGVVHLLQLAYAAVGRELTLPSTAEIRETYMKLTGGQDTGCVETTVLQAWSTKGLFGTHLLGWAAIDIHDHELLAAACYAFGGLYLGGDMPATLPERQFEEGEWWSRVPGDHPPADGHCFIGSGVTDRGVHDITWGSESGFTWGWWGEYGATAYVAIHEVFEEVGHGPLESINLPTLQADLAAV